MLDSQFFEYITSLLRESGHIIASRPIFCNHSLSETLYIDSTKDVILSRNDHALLATVDNISLIAEIEWSGVIDELAEKIQIFSATVSSSSRSRSQDIADIHFILQQFWTNSHSIVFFKNDDQFIISFADEMQSHILSDWHNVIDDYDKVVERISVANIALDDCSTYFDDFIYSIAREYYIYPISFENASYGMLPIDLLSPKFEVNSFLSTDEDVTKEDIKEIIRGNLSYYESLYGYDYVAVQYAGMRDLTSYRNLSDEIDRISFELDLAEEYGDEVDEPLDFNDEYEDEDNDFFGELDEEIDPAIFDNPVLMVKWLESKQKDNQDSWEAERHEQERLEAERREQERLEAERRERERLEAERRERERLEAERRERERLEAERREQERLEAERREQERLEAERRERERLEAERRERERLEAERRERERLEAERRERERLEAERRERERLEAERREQERLEAERREQKRLDEEHASVIKKIKQEYEIKIALSKQQLVAIEEHLSAIDTRLSRLNILQFMEKKSLKNEQTKLIEQKKQLISTIDTISESYESAIQEENIRYKNAEISIDL